MEHVEEQHADNNVQGDGNGGASGKLIFSNHPIRTTLLQNPHCVIFNYSVGANGTLIRKRRWYQLHEKHAVYAMVLERTEAGVLSRGVSKEVFELTGIP